MAYFSATLHITVSLFFLLPVASPAQVSPNISLGSSFSPHPNAPSSWSLSPSGDFTFGFLPLNPGSFLLAIWFAKLPSLTPVWWATNSAGDAVVVQQGSHAEVTRFGKLSLVNTTGQEVWFASPGNTVTGCALLDTGNLVLFTDSPGEYSWQSFDNPTDTILPSQSLGRGSKLTPRRSSNPNDFSAGRFQMRLLPDGNLVLNTVGFPTVYAYERYWISNNTYQKDDALLFDPNHGVAVVMNGTTVLDNVTGASFESVSDLYQRATLDYDGVFRQYKCYKQPGAGPWSAIGFVPDNICTSLRVQNGGSGACGYNSYCKIDGNAPTCACPDHYSPLDPEDILNQGCRPDFDQPSCEGYDSRDFDLVELQNADWPNEDYEQLSPMGQDGCRRACLEDCRCMVAVSGGGDCWKKKMPMSNGRMDSALGKLSIFKVRKFGVNTSRFDDGDDRKTKKAVVSLSVVLGASILFNLIAIPSVLLLLLSSKQRRGKRKGDEKKAGRTKNLERFTYAALEKATDGFKEELGKGAFGSVYKGEISESLIAVKKLNGMAQQGEKEFSAELSVIGRTHHKNLVQLIGFCDEGSHRLLVYEYMINGSLAGFLFQEEKPRWEKRVQIACGIARGLAYLHDECSNQIIHCDIKPQNILLDEYFTARISDFGLAKLLMSDQTRTKTSIRGTKGYVAPEWFKDKSITAKVDVYSFGVVLLEIVCCRKNVEKEFGDDERTVLTDWAYDCFVGKKMDALVQFDEDAISDRKRLERYLAVAIWCIQEEPSMRPSMKKVTQMLEGAVEVPLPPDPYSFISSIN